MLTVSPYSTGATIGSLGASVFCTLLCLRDEVTEGEACS